MAEPRILLTAPEGQVGWELSRSLLPLGRVVCLARDRLDLSRPGDIAAAFEAVRPDVVVNAAAHTAVDAAESEPDLAWRVNAEAPDEFARLARSHGALLVHYSTDYVFDGSGCGAFAEDHPTTPLGVYGRSKLAGELSIRDSGCDHLIFRTSWVYAARGKNFLRTILRLAAEREELRIVDDQIGAPTPARLIAGVTALALHQELRARRTGNFDSALLHLTAGGETSWHGFATAIVAGARALGMPVRCRSVLPIPTRDYPLPAARPLNSRLDCGRLMRRYGLVLPDWKTGLDRVLREMA